MARYSVNNYTVETLLSNIKSGSIAIPEMQRPFVWDSSKVRDLVDSLYKGFPVGYIIVWQNPDVKLKDGTKSSGKKVLIDGQQRITAMAAAIVGQEVLDDHYKWKRISIVAVFIWHCNLMELHRLRQLVPQSGVFLAIQPRPKLQLVVEVHANQLASEVAVGEALRVFIQKIRAALYA